MNGNGIPIIGAKPIVIPIFISKWIKSIDATQYPYTLQNFDFCFSDKKMIVIEIGIVTGLLLIGGMVEMYMIEMAQGLENIS